MRLGDQADCALREAVPCQLATAERESPYDVKSPDSVACCNSYCCISNPSWHPGALVRQVEVLLPEASLEGSRSRGGTLALQWVAFHRYGPFRRDSGLKA